MSYLLLRPYDSGWFAVPSWKARTLPQARKSLREMIDEYPDLYAGCVVVKAVCAYEVTAVEVDVPEFWED